MIISAGDFLVQALKPAARRMAWERGTLYLVAFAALGEPADSSRHLFCIFALMCPHVSTGHCSTIRLSCEYWQMKLELTMDHWSCRCMCMALQGKAAIVC